MNICAAKIARRLLLVSTFMVVASCGGRYNDYDPKADPIDRASGLERKDYIDSLFPKPAEATIVTKAPVLPKATDIIITPEKPRIGINKTVSLSVTEDVPLKDVFIELARRADVDIEVDPNITGGVIFKATNRPFDDVIQRICDLAGLRYSVNAGVIRIERDIPYVENYQANFLNLIRTSNGKIDVDTKTLGNDNSSGGSSGSSSSGSTSSGSSSSSGSSGSSSSTAASATGSTSSISSKNGGEGDIWSSIQNELTAIIGGTPSTSSKSSSGGGSFSPPSGGRGAPVSFSANAVDATAAASDGDKPYITLNREAGIISVRTTAKNQAKVKEYLSRVKNYYSSQVLIEAKVIEVALNDEFRSGVDWSLLTKKGGLSINLPSSSTFTTPNLTGPVNAGNFSTIAFDKSIFKTGDLNVAVQLAQIFGTTKTLSSPRILVMNNQQAILNFSVNENYFTVSCTATSTSTANVGTTTIPAVTSSLHTIPIGLILGLQTSIDTVNNEVIMNVHPTLSRLTGQSISDPAAAACNNITGAAATTTPIISTVPQVDIREMDSILRIKSGEVMAIGGMIDQKNDNNDTGIPFLSDIPILGYAFKTVDKQNQTTQTIIFLKATIVPGYGVDAKDQELYNKFNNDPHPMNF